MNFFVKAWMCVFLACVVPLSVAVAKETKSRLTDYKFIEAPAQPSNPPEIGGSMFRAAAATTTLLAWYQFDNPVNGQCDEQGWTTHDMTTQIKKYWHVAGTPCTDAIVPIAGTKSMWCGQWTVPSTLDPWCGWVTLPGYGNNWDQSIETTVSNVTSVGYSIAWDSEPGYDFTYAEWYDPVGALWVADPAANAGAGGYDGAGGPLAESLTSPYGATKFRFHVLSDGAWSDQDGLWPTAQGAVVVDNVSINGGAAETFEGAACNAQTVGPWTATIPPGYGIYAHLTNAGLLVQEDPCNTIRSCVWVFIDDPAVTNYACGGFPLQGAVPYGPDAAGFYMWNEIWSPWIPATGSGGQFLLQFATYRDLPLDNLVFYMWHVTSRNAGGCPIDWGDSGFAYYGGQKDWIRTGFDISTMITPTAADIRVALGAIDMCGPWCGVYGSGSCHSHAPVFDQVKVLRVTASGPQWVQRDIDMFQDNFPENGNITSTSYARCDMAQDILPSTKKRLCFGDSLKIVVTDPLGLAADNTGGRTDTKAVYIFVRVADRFGNPVAGKNGLAIQSPENKRYATDPAAGLLRYPHVAGIAPAGWDAYRCDRAYTPSGGAVKDTYCADLMDIGAYLPAGWHGNEPGASEVGIFAPGDVVHYFLAAKNTAGTWSYGSRTFSGQGLWFRSNNVNDCVNSPMEWSVLPDAGRLAGDAGDILYVDDSDDRGGPAQLYFDWAFTFMNIQNRVDRFDVLGPSSVVGNSLASRVKNIQTQMIGDPPTEVYQKVLWNCSDLSRGLMGDGGTPNGGSSAEKSNDFGLCEFFLTNHPNNPGWAYWGDDVVQDWATLVGINAVNVKSVYMNHTLVGGDQKFVTGVVSPKTFSLPLTPWTPETCYAYGGCLVINDFDMPGAAGSSAVGHLYNAQANAPATVYQATLNAASTTARFFLAGFGFNFIRDDDLDGIPDYAPHLRSTLVWMENVIDEPIGIDPVAFANALENAYPNPFNPTTTIKYSVAERGQVTLKIYNAAGQLVRTLVDEEQAPTADGFSVSWNGTNDRGRPVASGVYFYQLTAKDFEQTKKMVLLK